MLSQFKLIEREAGEVLHAESFEVTDLQAERRQAERWNRHYCVGEPRVSSRLYKLSNRRWKLYMSLGI